MCGLFGYYSTVHDISKEDLSHAMRALTHRGPDASHTWINSNGKVALGHTRLATIDMGSIQQPLTNSENSIKAIVNGEFYTYQSIRDALEDEGYIFKTKTDSEILIALYQNKGIHCLSELRGEFAFILWDEQTNSLIAARDRFGIKPLYYAFYNDALYLASEMNALFSAGIKATCSEHALFHHAHCHLPQDKTLFSNIYQVPPGHFLMMNDNTMFKLVRYWDIDYPAENQEKFKRLSIEDAIQTVHNALIESVSIRLQADVPVGCYLSGGIDSSALLGIASRLSSQPIEAFSICFEEERFNEGTIAEETARYCGAKYNPVLVTENDIADNFASAVIQSGMIFPNAAGVARFLLSKHVRQNNCKIVLSGEGADELFFGYSFMQLEALLNDELKQTIDHIDEHIKQLNAQFPLDRSNVAHLPKTMASINKILGYMPRWIESQAFFNATHRYLFSENFSQTFQSYNPYLEFLSAIDVNGQMRGRDLLNQSNYLWFKSFFVNNMLNYIGDRAEMAHSVEARLPYLDHHLFDLVKNVSITSKFKGNVDKYILREAVKPYVTDTVYHRRKYIFQAPPVKLNAASRLFQLYQDIIRTHLPNLAFYCPKKVHAFLDGLVDIDKTDIPKLVDGGVTLSTLASVAVLHNRYN